MEWMSKEVAGRGRVGTWVPALPVEEVERGTDDTLASCGVSDAVNPVTEFGSAEQVLLPSSVTGSQVSGIEMDSRVEVLGRSMLGV